MKTYPFEYPLLLDGGFGRELQARGESIAAPLWSANVYYSRPEIVKEIHLDFIHAGAEIITTNTYAITEYYLKKAGKQGEQHQLLHAAYDFAHQARQCVVVDYPIYIAASIPPLSESYRADLVANVAKLEAEYTMLIDTAVKNNVDILLAETLSHSVEAKVIAKIAKQCKLPLWISFTVNAAGNLRSGESLQTVATQILDMGVHAVLVNCATLPNLNKSIEILQALSQKKPFTFGVYGNRFNEIPTNFALENGLNTINTVLSKKDYVHAVKTWLDKGASIIGGCCGIGPEYITEIKNNLQ
ncbi:homocysteine S-methyltransferase family protein [Candidatus Uabimicrobium amorphum]|uniref:Homocysteine S-methyltransferase n=1 Tax=Uabimicrobium amorphum TaxID=2596890 RepID=A0A5S9F119_UABAM|nr:homocysteine S-methyltransferase family protein [Candidatus Uabimicrobium amorphum]BBM82147.1 homocysteine S-methyltransferase [Candidatus Uabimicrobium amorphum]